MNPHANFNFEKASKDLRNLLFNIADVKQKDIKEFEYKGVEIESSSILATNENIKDTFNEEGIQYHSERGRDLIDLFIQKVFQLGYSVGNEFERERNRPFIELVDKYLNENLNNLKVLK